MAGEKTVKVKAHHRRGVCRVQSHDRRSAQVKEYSRSPKGHFKGKGASDQCPAQITIGAHQRKGSHVKAHSRGPAEVSGYMRSPPTRRSAQEQCPTESSGGQKKGRRPKKLKGTEECMCPITGGPKGNKSPKDEVVKTSGPKKKPTTKSTKKSPSTMDNILGFFN